MSLAFNSCSAPGELPADLQAPHRLPEQPDWNAPEVVNACAAPYGAKSDNATDDAAAIQCALDENPVVFLPKGYYRFGKPMVLKPGRKLIGAGRVFTVLLPLSNAPGFTDGDAPAPLIDTVDSSDGDTTIARLEVRSTRSGAYALRWRAGARPVVLDVNVSVGDRHDPPRGPFVLVDGNGGGRWYNYFSMEPVESIDAYRSILVRGTRQPLVFYVFNPEHARDDMMTEFVDTRNVTLYALKGENLRNPLGRERHPSARVRARFQGLPTLRRRWHLRLRRGLTAVYLPVRELFGRRRDQSRPSVRAKAFRRSDNVVLDLEPKRPAGDDHSRKQASRALQTSLTGL